MRAVFRWIGTLLALLAVAIVVLFLVFDWNWIKDYVAGKASNALGQTVTIAGDIDIELSLKPDVRVEGIRIDNADWSPEPHMLKLPLLTFQIDLLKLLQGRLLLSEIELSEPTIRLERSEQGQLNWAKLDPSDAEEQKPESDERNGTNLPTLGRLVLRDGRFVYHDYASREEVISTVAELTATTTGVEQTLDVKGTGQFADKPLQLTLHTGSLADLETATSVPLRGQLTVGEMRARVEGTVTQPLQLAGADLDVSLQGAPPEALFTVLNVPGSSPQPLRLQGHLSHKDAKWTLRELAATLGKSDLSGTATLDRTGEQPFVRADLASTTLDIPSLVAMVQGQQSQQATTGTDNQEMIPKVSFEPKRLQMLDAKLTFQGENVIVANQTLHNVEADLTLQDGHLVLEPKAEFIGGTIRAELDVESIPTPMQSSIHANIERVNLKNVLTLFDLPKEAFGAVNGVIDLAGTGHTLETFLDTVDGEVVVTMNGGRLDQLLLELAGLDLGEAIVSAFTGADQAVPLRCVAIDFNVQDGRMQAKTLVISTTDSKIVGDGFIDLGKERVNLTLKPEAKDFSAFSADAPIQIQGPFSNLSLSTNIGQALLSLATPVQMPEAESANCQALL